MNGNLSTGMRLAAVTARNRRECNANAIGIAGWLLCGDSPGPIEAAAPIGPGGTVTVALANGLRGHPDGHVAAWIAARELSVAHDDSDPASRYRRADAAIRAERSSSGCAAATAELRPDGVVTITNVGDVRIYHLVDGYAGELTTDYHRAAARFGPEVTACLGGPGGALLRPHVHEVTLRPGERLLMCTDGLRAAVDVADVQSPADASLERIAGDLIRAALNTRYGANVTAVVVEPTWTQR